MSARNQFRFGSGVVGVDGGRVGNLLLCFQPTSSRKHVEVTKQRRPVEWADCMKELMDLDDPNAIRIGVIPDTLHTHNPVF